MRCLWITRQDPRPANSGELIYSLGLIRGLADHPGIELTVLAHRAAGNTALPPDNLHWELHGDIPTGRLRSLVSAAPSDSFRLGNPAMRGHFERLLASHPWDWIIVDQAACGWILSSLPSKDRPRLAYLAHNHEAQVRREVAADHSGPLPMRLALKWDAAKYARLEHALCAAADLITAITPRDQAAFEQDFPGKARLVLPPGYEGTMVAAPPAITADTPRKVVLAGAFEWLAKRRNLEGFLAAAAEPFRAAGISFTVAGKTDPAYFGSLAAAHPWAEFHANVPSIDPFLKGARIGLIPEALGGGFKLKALDYIFRGLPLAALEPALSGLPLTPGRDVISASSTEALAAGIARRIDDLDFLNASACRALEACRHSFHWPDRGAALGRALESHPPP